mmetsp:Transcript_18302/g.44922  ORF Transcript_18302/g.44922 Transcript_18302/m.44922 type:complete len:94 (+) Transcript_18302:452-733(+)
MRRLPRCGGNRRLQRPPPRPLGDLPSAFGAFFCGKAGGPVLQVHFVRVFCVEKAGKVGLALGNGMEERWVRAVQLLAGVVAFRKVAAVTPRLI